MRKVVNVHSRTPSLVGLAERRRVHSATPSVPWAGRHL